MTGENEVFGAEDIFEGFDCWDDWNANQERLKKDEEYRQLLIKFAREQLQLLLQKEPVIKGHDLYCRCPQCGPQGDISD